MGDCYSKDESFIEIAEELLEHLKENHNSEKTAIKSGEICELYSIHKERVRAVVNYLRSISCPVCSSSRGYWYSEKKEDIAKTLNHLEGRISGMNRAITGLKRVKTGV